MQQLNMYLKPGDVQQMASSEMVGRKLRQDHGAIQCPEIQSASHEHSWKI